MIFIQSVIIISFFLVSLIEFGGADAQEQEIVTNDTSALMEKGLALVDLGQNEEAIRYFDKVIAIDPNDVDALINKGSTFIILGKYEEAIKYYDKVLAIDPNNALASGNKGLANDYLDR